MSSDINNVPEEVIGCGELDEPLELELLEAAGPDHTGAHSASLEAHLHTCDRCRQELGELRALAGAIVEDRERLDPGDHFFASLHDDVLASLVTDKADDRPVRGKIVEISSPDQPGLLATLVELFTRRPTVAYGALMGAALVVIVVWSVSGLDLAGGPEGPDGDPSPPQAALSKGDLIEVQRLAQEIQIDLDAPSYDDEDPDDDDMYGPGLVGSVDSMSDEEIERFGEELERML